MHAQDHLVTLADGWALWRWVCLRGAGFEAARLTALARPELLARIDAFLDAEVAVQEAMAGVLTRLRGDFGSVSHEALLGLRRARKRAEKGKVPAIEDVAAVAEEARALAADAVARRDALRAEVDAVYAIARGATTKALRDAAADPLFREAVISQNRGAVANGLDALLRSTPADEGKSQQRQHEELVASYLHRYCAKNDSIGFYGPIGWGAWSAEEPTVVLPGPHLVDTRGWYLEQWGIDELARVIAEIEGVRAWLPPRRFGFVVQNGRSVESALSGSHALSALESAVLAAVDGVTPARDLRIEGASESDVAQALAALEKQRLVAWSFDLPATWLPDDLLFRRFDVIGDDRLRDRARAMLEQLRAPLAEATKAAGNPEQIATSLAALDSAFHTLTGTATTRNAGVMYASRTLAFEDAHRDCDVRLGARVRSDLAPALALVLDSARWLSHAAASSYVSVLDEIYAQLAPEGGATAFVDIWFRAQRFVLGTKENRWEASAQRASASWEKILAPELGARRIARSSATLRPYVERAFAVPRAGWACARHHSPDLMISATSLDAIEHGDYVVVLGEIHFALNTVLTNVFAAQHPRVELLVEAAERDVPEPNVAVVPAKDSKLGGSRVAHSFLPSNSFDLDVGLSRSPLPSRRVLALTELTVTRENGSLVVRSDDRRFEAPLFEMFASSLASKMTNALDFLPRSLHRPRVTIDRLVIQRETWSVAPSTLPFLAAANELDLVIGARAWARALDLPRFVFVKSPLEQKPIYVDFQSPVSLRILARILRHARDHVGGERSVSVSEMLPDLDHLWLPDAEGRKYTSEFRIVAADQRR